MSKKLRLSGNDQLLLLPFPAREKVKVDFRRQLCRSGAVGTRAGPREGTALGATAALGGRPDPHTATTPPGGPTQTAAAQPQPRLTASPSQPGPGPHCPDAFLRPSRGLPTRRAGCGRPGSFSAATTRPAYAAVCPALISLCSPVPRQPSRAHVQPPAASSQEDGAASPSHRDKRGSGAAPGPGAGCTRTGSGALSRATQPRRTTSSTRPL